MNDDIAERLRIAQEDRVPILPFATELGIDDIDTAYAIQNHGIASRTANGRKVIGRKIGLTSIAAQTQLGFDQPIHGPLFADGEILNGGAIEAESLIAPILEGEIALVLDRDIDDPNVSIEEFSNAIKYVLPAIEIADSRIKNWEISLFDLIADDSAAARYLLGTDPQQLSNIDLSACQMELNQNGKTLSSGLGENCMGSPLNAGHWLGGYLIEQGGALRAGDILLTGALGPIVPAYTGDQIECTITGFGPLSVEFV
ncbi:MAG: fumarylacetoacetate hydrolase family protein [Parasphingorhabdus sp.]